MKKIYLITFGIAFLLSVLANLAITHYLLVPVIVLFFCYGAAAYFVSRVFGERISAWTVGLIFICLLIFGQLIAAVIVRQFHLYMLINALFFTLGTLGGILFHKGKMTARILVVLCSVVLCWYYQNLTRVNREFPATEMYEKLLSGQRPQ